MSSKALLFGIIGFLLGGLVVSIAATQLEDDDEDHPSAEMTMAEMSDSLRGKSGDDFDAAFISGMIQHHDSAISMAELAEAQAKHDEIKELATAIIRAQEEEISQMQQWQMDWDYEDSTTAMHR